MVYDTGNEALLQKLPDKSQISGRRQWILLLEIEKKVRKTLNTFQKLLNRLARALSTIRAGRARAVEKMFMRKLQRTGQLETSGNTGTIPK